MKHVTFTHVFEILLTAWVCFVSNGLEQSSKRLFLSFNNAVVSDRPAMKLIGKNKDASATPLQSIFSPMFQLCLLITDTAADNHAINSSSRRHECW